MTLRAHHEAEAVLTDIAARMDDDAIPYKRIGDHHIGPDRAITTDAHLRPDDGIGPDQSTGPDLRRRSNHRTGIDCDTGFESCRRVDMRAGDIASFGERRRPQRLRE